MGDRYTITSNLEELKSRFEVDIPVSYQAKYNACPTQLLPVITQNSEGLSFFYWGQIPGWSKNKALSSKLLYADIDSLLTKKSLNNALQNNRCIIPADSIYDWKRISKKGRVAHRFEFLNPSIKSLAGFWEEFEDEKGNMHHTFKIVSSPAPNELSNQSGILPVIVKKDQEQLWLSNEKDTNILMNCLETLTIQDMNAYTVSPKIENASLDQPDLIKPFAPADQFGNYSLFD